MALLRPDFELSLQLVHLGPIMQELAVESTVSEVAETSLGLFGCPDVSMETQTQPEAWGIDETSIAREDEVFGIIDEVLGPSGLNDNNSLTDVLASGNLNGFGGVDHSEDLAELERFVVNENHNQIEDAVISQSQQAASAVFSSYFSSNVLSGPTISNDPLLFCPTSSSPGSFLSSKNDDNTLTYGACVAPAIDMQSFAPNELITNPNDPMFGDFNLFESECLVAKPFGPCTDHGLLFGMAENDPFEPYESTFAGDDDIQISEIVEDQVVEREISIPQVPDWEPEACAHSEVAPSSPGQTLSSKNYVLTSEPQDSTADDSQNSGDLAAEGVLTKKVIKHYKNDLPALPGLSLGSVGGVGASQGNNANPSILASVPRTFPLSCELPASFSKQAQIDLDIEGTIKALSKDEYQKLSVQLGSFKPSTNGAQGRQRRRRAQSGADEQNRVSKPKRTRRSGKRQFDYTGIEIPSTVHKFDFLQNNAIDHAKNEHKYEKQLIALSEQDDCLIGRTRYHRGNIDILKGLHEDVQYEPNPFFKNDRPYQQEFTRMELDPVTKVPLVESRCALCVYCEDIHFYELKNSCYSQHMSHSHGVYTDEYMTPNPLLIGQYQIAKKASPKRKTQPRTRCHEGVVCPACFQVVEVRCWSSTSVKKPLSNYLRHFKEVHRIDKNKITYYNTHA